MSLLLWNTELQWVDHLIICTLIMVHSRTNFEAESCDLIIKSLHRNEYITSAMFLIVCIVEVGLSVIGIKS